MTSRIRVLRLIARLNIGGPALHVAALHAGLDPARYECRLITGMPGPSEGDMSDLLDQPHLRPEILPEMGREVALASDARTLSRLIQIMRRFKPHIVHTHTAKAGAVGRLAARLTGSPVVVHTFHGHVFRDYFSPFKSRMTVLTERFLAGLSDRLITLSERLRDEIAAFGVAPRSKIEVIPLGLDLERFAQADGREPGAFRASLGIGPGETLVGSVGRLAPIKNHGMFLRAAQSLRQSGRAARFVIVGDGEERAALEAEAGSLGLNGDVFFTGWRRDLPNVYGDLDLLVNTSLNEGTPVAVIEAMAARVPVVATCVGGVPDVVADGQTGTLVPSGDAEALARALAERIDHWDDTRRMADAAFSGVVQRYSRQQLVENIDGLYQRLLTARGLA